MIRYECASRVTTDRNVFHDDVDDDIRMSCTSRGCSKFDFLIPNSEKQRGDTMFGSNWRQRDRRQRQWMEKGKGEDERKICILH